MPRLEEAGLRVCVGFRDFDVGRPMLINVERAVESSRHVLLVLTPEWMESRWGIFESLLIQTTDPAGRRRRMLPLLLEHCEPPPRIAMLTYADFTDRHEHARQLERVLDAVKGKRRLSDLGQSLGRVLYETADVSAAIGRHIISFDALIAERTEGFVGRQFVFETLDAFLADQPSGYFVVRGDPGIGKTALMGQLVKTRKLIHHFNVIQQNIRSPQLFFTNVCAQLIARFELSSLTIRDEPMQDSTFLVECLEAAAADPGNCPLVVALDALDEADWQLLPARVNVHYLPPALPEGVYVVASTRPDQDIPLNVVRRRDLDIEQDSVGNLLDVRAYLETYARREGIGYRLAEWRIDAETFVAELLHKSQGNFMYLHYVLPDIEAGRLGRGGVGELPQGLQSYYQGHWAQMKERVGGDFEETHERVICVLGVMAEPVSLDNVASWTGLRRRDVRRILDNWDQFLLEDIVDGERLYRVYHASFAEFLSEQVDLRDYSDLVATDIEAKIDRARRGK